MAAHVEHQTAISVARRVFDRHVRHGPFHAGNRRTGDRSFAEYLCRQQLQEGLDTIECSLGGLRLDGYALGCRQQAVTFFAEAGVR
ncbi:hypothetical protein D3C87_1708970 [compost metagenome]